MAAKPWAAAKALAKVEETLNRVHEPLDNGDDEPQKRNPGRFPQAGERLEQVAQDVDAARHEHQRGAGQRETVTQSSRAIGPASHCVDLERGGRRHGTLIAGDIQRHIDTIRPIAPHEHLSETCLERIATAERGGPTMQATITFVSGYGRQQVRQMDLAPPVSYARPAQRIPSFSLDRVASTRTVTAGAPLRALAERMRPCIFKERCGKIPVTQSLDVTDRLSLGPPRPERSVGRHVLDSSSPYSCLVPLSPYLQGRAGRSSYG